MILAASFSFLSELVALCAACVFVAYICFRLRLLPIVGFLIAGVLIGPHGIGLVYEQELVDILAEVGIILLLFTIGVEFSLEEFARLGRQILIGGAAQVMTTVGIAALALATFGFSWQVGVYTGCLIALSSTAIVLGQLNERRESGTPVGRMSLAILIFQDMAVVAMVLLVPMLSGEGGTAVDIGSALLRAGAMIAVVVVLARRVIPFVLDRIVQTRRLELFLLSVITICFGAAALSNMIGVGLPLGAFLAGLLVSESHYRDQALAEVLPLRVIFNAMFFASVGMLLDIRYVLSHPVLVLSVALGVVLFKSVLAGGATRLLGFPAKVSISVGLVLAQIGEFSFVLERAGRSAGMEIAGGSQLFIAVSVLLMMATPALMQSGPKLAARIAPGGDEDVDERAHVADELEDHVIIVGYGPAGQRLAAVLEDVRVPFVVVDINPGAVRDLNKRGVPALYGDATRHAILEAAGVERAKVIVAVISDTEATRRLAAVARYVNPTLLVITRTRLFSEIDALKKAGADIIVPEELETTVRIFSHVLGAYMIPTEEIEAQAKALRAADYGILRGSIQEAHLMVLQGLDDDGLHTRAVSIRPGAPAADRTLASLALRRDHSIAVLAVRREGRTIANPSGEFAVHVGDRLVLVGSADNFVETADLFRTPTPPTP